MGNLSWWKLLDGRFKDCITIRFNAALIETGQPQSSVAKEGTRLVSITVSPTSPAATDVAGTGADVSTTTIESKVFIDASYEGDLLAAAGVSFIVGRESEALYGEHDAGVRPLNGYTNFPYPVRQYKSRSASSTFLRGVQYKDEHCQHHTVWYDARRVDPHADAPAPMVMPALPAESEASRCVRPYPTDNLSALLTRAPC